jgi:hypothetical protein
MELTRRSKHTLLAAYQQIRYAQQRLRILG